ncbi:GHMP family kinase ATP-binding protein [Fundicoccus culcitae]|uniref:GHMP kinase N-terminal domain-containing protein n=1 Tax=Fundicoccus culcitae TaxID=2969821 RepID=A0ABY5P464_9LACT|nr:hypothetical protein [Fundicoccus culcitae]UUX33344.1 hypothetical protein NRE15_10590 [Fundicoccus culcitae]
MGNKVVKVSFPASCGELVQGKINNERFLCSYAINCYTHVTIKKVEEGSNILLPEKAQKLVNFTKKFIRDSEKKWEKIDIQIDNSIPYEKGMGSSTADLVSLSIALSEYFDLNWNPTFIAKVLTQIEATDSLVFPSLTLMNPDTGESILNFTQDKYYSVACIIPSESINTSTIISSYSERDWNIKAYSDLLNQTTKAFDCHSLDQLIKVAELSALLNEKILTKPFLEGLIKLKSIQGIKGLNVSHTGTVIGIIYDESVINKIMVTNLIQSIDLVSYYQIKHYKMVLPYH